MQQTDAGDFTVRLGDVWRECARVLKPGGLLVFTYHHSRPEGWHSILEALQGAGFAIVAAHPIKAEMSVAMPKNQAREPIDLDIVVVCRNREEVRSSILTCEDAWTRAVEVAGEQIDRLRRVGRTLSRNDLRIVVMAQIVRFLSVCAENRATCAFVEGRNSEVEDVIDSFALTGTGGSR